MAFCGYYPNWCGVIVSVCFVTALDLSLGLSISDQWWWRYLCFLVTLRAKFTTIPQDGTRGVLGSQPPSPVRRMIRGTEYVLCCLTTSTGRYSFCLAWQAIVHAAGMLKFILPGTFESGSPDGVSYIQATPFFPPQLRTDMGLGADVPSDSFSSLQVVHLLLPAFV